MSAGWLRACAWWLAFLSAALGPLALALLGDLPAPRALLLEFGVMLGLLGLGVLSMQAVISGRQRWFARGIGQDDLLQFHRQIGLFGLLLVLAHPATLLLADSRFLAYLDPRVDVLRALSLSLLLLATVTLVATSLWRLQLGLSYERWRLLHGLLALAIVALGLGHALLVDHYTAASWKKAALLILVGGSLCLVLDTRLRRPWRARRRPWRVASVHPERDACWTISLTGVNGQALAFRPGQFVWLTLGDSPWRLQQHPFTVASSPVAAGALEFTIKALGDFTRSIAGIEPGTCAWLEGPYGVFTYNAGNSPGGVVFIAGGVGITPVMSILRTLRERGAREPLWLIYGSECWNKVVFREELEDLASRLELTVIHVLDQGHDGWRGETGHIDAGVLERHLPAHLADLPCYLCGPAAMADLIEPELRRRGVPAHNLYSERFDLV
jgi:predicted ferric reductase